MNKKTKLEQVLVSNKTLCNGDCPYQIFHINGVQLRDTEKQVAESERARRNLENLGHLEDDRLSRLNIELNEVTGKNEELELRYRQISDEIREQEIKLEEEEMKCGKADAQLKDLESEVMQVKNNVQNLSTSEVNASEKEQHLSLQALTPII